MMKQLCSATLLCLCSFTAWCFQAPANNNCATASEIVISNGGFGLGDFISETVDMGMATLEPGEYLPPNVTPPTPGSVWFEFYLPTSRQVKITFARTSGSANARVALAVYKDGVCLPAAADLYNLLLPLDNYGDVLNPCVGPGHYRIQVISTLPSIERIYLVLNIAPSQTANVPVFDLPTEAHNFNTVFGGSVATHKIECHSIDGPEEYACLPVADSARYTKSSWYVFRFTDAVTDLIRIRVAASGLPDSIGYRLFEGDCRAVPPFSLPVIFDCGFLEKNNNTVRSIEHPCLLKPNTWYSFQLLFPQTFESGNTTMAVWVDRRGEKPTAAPRPLIGQIPAPSNQLGTLPQGPGAGTTTNFTDYFSCNGRMALNDCGAVNPATGVDFNGRHFDIATFATFELAMPANITLNFQNSFIGNEFPLVRLFNGAPDGDCNTLDPVAALVGQFQAKTWQTKCLPAGKYTLQVLGSIGATWQNPINPYPQGGWDYGHLGLPFTLNITAQLAQQATDFSLRQSGNVDRLNGFQALQPGVLYNAQPGLFGCDNSVLPAGSVCFNRKKMMVREWQIGDGPGGQPEEGLITLSNLAVHYSPGNVNNPPAIRYRVYSSSLHDLANAQNAHAEGELIAGAATLSGCIPSNGNSPAAPIDSFCFCAVRDTYALAGFGDYDQINHGDQPRVLFKALQTTYSSRDLAENMGNISAPGLHISEPDFYSCLNNPATLGGKQPCYQATKIIYREFYLDQPRTLSIQHEAGSTGDLRLFSGQASDPAATLSVVAQVTDCFGVFSDPCLVFQPGWYTLVSYGHGPGYDIPVFNNGDKGDVGKLSQVSIAVETPDLARYNRPYKAYNAGVTNWKTAQANVPSASTDSLYVLGTETFACTPDTPFSIHPIQPCVAGENRFAYYVFEITEPSYVVIQNVPKQYHTEVFAFDVRIDSARLLTDTPVYPCAVTQKKQLCNLPPGVYTLVIFAKDADKKKSVTPELYIERAGTSRFDHAVNAYDFGVVPGDGQWYNGKVGDTHPNVPGLAPSYDVFYCSTGAQLTDPPEGIPFTGVGHNPNVYNPVVPYVLFTDNIPTASASGTQQETWRNLWMSFVLTGSGDATLRLDLPVPAAEYPAMVVYESDVNGTIPFATLQSGDGIDSVKTDGLTKIEENFFLAGATHDKTLSFNKNGCIRDTVRYYLVLTMKNMLPNLPVAVSISYNAQPTVAAPYDLYPDANVINGLQQTAPPYTPLALGAGLYRAAPFVLNCATRSPGDPSSSSCYTRSVWYKIEVGTAGKLRINLEQGLNPAVQANYFWGTNLYRETVPGNPASLVEINTSSYNKPHPQYPYLNEWEEGCVSPGTYYLFLEDCFTPPTGLDIHTAYRPVIWIEESPGDFCSNAVPVDVPAAGVFSASTDVDCHTIGEGFGEDGSAMGCLGAPTGFKSTWYKITVSGNDKLDITFQLDLPAGVDGNLLRYRLLYGACTAMTPGPCNTNGNTIFTLNCLTAGDYYVQLISPQNLKNKIGVKVTAAVSADQNCIPVNPVAPFAAFSYTAGCDSVQFQNTSTVGPDIQYQWLFPGGLSSTALEPVFYPNGPGSYPVTLIVRNSVFQLADTLTQIIVIQDPTAGVHLSDLLLCNSETGALDATLPGASYLWQDGSTQPTQAVTQSGLYWVDISAGGCTRRDTALVTTVQSAFTLDDLLCSGETVTVGNEVFDGTNPSGVVTLPNAGFAGCDSIVTVNLTFLPADSTLVHQKSCNPNNAGVFIQNLNNQYGCDSTVVTTVTFDAAGVDTTLLQATTCDPALAGTTQTLLTGAGGCDSLLITVTSLLPTDSIFLQQVTCNPNSAGVFVQNLDNQHGCDSTVVTTITYDAAAIDTTLLQAITCDPTLAGTAQTLLAGTDGCDSLVVTVTTLIPADSTFLQQVTCDPDSAGVLVQNLNNQYGCDSTVVTTVTFDPAGIDTTMLQANTCDPALAGTAQTLLTGADGCDSLVVTVTTLIPADSTFLQQVTCDPDNAGVLVQNLNNHYGCDSTVVTTVTFDPAGIDTTMLQAATCDPALAGTAQTLLAGADGCDSLVITVTTLLPSDSIFFQQVTCNPNNAGIFVQNLNNEYGCDSTVVTTITFDATAIDTTIVQLSTCDQAGVGSVQNLLIGADGCDSLVITVTSLDLSDCPPVIQIDAFEPNCAGGSDGYFILTVFGGQAPYQFSWSGGSLTGAGQILTDNDTRQIAGLPAGAYTVTVTGQNGLSAVSSLLLMQPPAMSVQANAVLVSGPYAVRCADAQDGVIQGVASGGTAPYLFAWSVPGQTGATLTGVAAGIYGLTVTDARGCTAVAQAEILAPLPVGISLQVSVVKCGDPDVEVTVAPSGGVPPFSLTANGLPVAGLSVRLADGEHLLEIADVNGCTVDTILELDIPPAPEISLPADTLINLGQPLSIEAGINLLVWDTVVWTPLPDTGCAGCLRQTWIPGAKSQLYRVTITDLYGCTAQATIQVRVEKTLEVYVPNAFYPGRASGNDVFRINAGASVVEIQEARIYDRWGSLVYQWDNPVDPNQWPGWDGRIAAQAAAPGVYVYYFRVLLTDGSVEIVEGSLTLFR